MVQVGIKDPKAFLIGGGEIDKTPLTMFMCRELVKTGNKYGPFFKFETKKQMKYARHGHSVCAIADRYIMVSGSRKEINIS